VSWWSAGAEESGWQAIMPEPAPLACLVIGGNGKDLGLEVALADGPDWQEEFTAATRAFLADGGELSYRVGVKIALAALPGSPARHGDPR
jgi:hypothetical protein